MAHVRCSERLGVQKIYQKVMNSFLQWECHDSVSSSHTSTLAETQKSLITLSFILRQQELWDTVDCGLWTALLVGFFVGNSDWQMKYERGADVERHVPLCPAPLCQTSSRITVSGRNYPAKRRDRQGSLGVKLLNKVNCGYKQYVEMTTDLMI